MPEQTVNAGAIPDVLVTGRESEFEITGVW